MISPVENMNGGLKPMEEELERLLEVHSDKLVKLNELFTKEVVVKAERRNGGIYHIYLEIDTCYLTGELIDSISKMEKAFLNRIEEVEYLADTYRTYLK